MKTRLLLILLLISSFAFAQYPTNGLIGQYGFDSGNLLVDGANGNNFTQTGTALTEITNRFLDAQTSAVSLNGDHLARTNVNYPNSGSDLDLGSVSFWIKTTTNDSEIRTILDDTNGRSDATTDNTWAGYYVYLKDGKIGVSVRVQYSSAAYGYQGFGNLDTTVISDGAWHHVAITMKNTSYFTGATDIVTASVALYVDGEAAGNSGVSKSSSGALSLVQSTDTNGNVTVGNNRTNSFPAINRYHDAIDDILFYGRRLSAAEIETIANYNFCFPQAPTNFTISNKTETSFDISWPEDGDFELAYVLKGQPFSGATIVPVNGYTSGDLQTISGLMPSHFYDIYLREKCSPTVWSSWSDAKEVRTKGRIYVNENASGNNDGSSFVNGFTDLQDALTASENGQEIWIAQGTYKADATDKTVSFVINQDNMKIYGGFNGTETNILQRNIAANPTILSGDLNGDDTGVDFSGNNRSDNTETIIHDNAQNLLLDGLIISDGHNSAHGAGLRKNDGINVLTVKNSEFRNNVALSSGAGINVGVGTGSNSTVNVLNTIFSNNVARHGTSIYVVTSGWRSSTVNITNSLFKDNIAKDNGSTKGFAGSAGWFRTTYAGNNNTTNVNLTNNTYVNNQDLGTYTGLNNFNRATVGVSKTGNNNTIANVSNCIFWGNTTAGGAAAKSIAEVHSDPGTVNVFNSIGEDGFSNHTNLTNTSNADPLFVNNVNDFTLQTTSPAKDTGDNSKLPLNTLTDLVGNSRIFNTAVDMGPYEFGASVPANYILTTSAANGSVTNNPEGNSFVELTTVELTATPDTGYQFSEWSGDASGTTNPLSITMDADKNITAVFIPIQYTLTINTVNNGTVTTNPNPVNGTYDAGTTVTLTATPGAGSQFIEWTGDATGTVATTIVLIDGDKTVTANFTEGATFVDLNATGNNDGSSWANAYADLQTAINNTAVDKTIWVAKGTYIPTGNGRSATFSLNKKQKIYGGFAGTESSFEDRDISMLHTANATILSGDINQDDNATILDTESTRQDNAYHVVTVKGNFASGGILNGFVITGGNSNGGLSNNCSTASASQYDRRTGGAIYTNPDGENFKVYMKINNCVIEKNTGLNYAVLGRFSPCGDQGTQSHVDFTSCKIKDNYSANTANIGFTGSQQYNIRSYGSIVNSLITGNSNGVSNKSSALIISSGGGSGNNPSALVSVINTTITNNSSTNNKAVTISLKSASSYPVYFYNSIIYNNGATNPITISGTNGSSATFANNIVEGGQYASNGSDPMFSNPSSNDFTLQTSSPAVDSGNNANLPSSVVKDLNGNTRVFNTTVDIGAYEYNSTLSVENFEIKNEFTIYPNPASNVLNIKMKQDFNKAEVYNIQGQKVLESKTKSLNVSNLPSGMYLIQVEDTNGNSQAKQFIKH